MGNPRCRREGCRREARKSSKYPHCCPICAHLDMEFDRVQDMFLTYDDDPRTTDVWTALVEASDAWSHYLEARRALVAAYPQRQRRTTH